MINPKTIKIIVIIFVVGAVCKFCYWAGVNSATADFQDERLQLISKQDEDLKKAIVEGRKLQRVEDEKVIDLLREENNITERSREIEREINTTDFACERMPNFFRMFNSAIPE